MSALPVDMENYIVRHYPDEVRDTVRGLVAAATIHDGSLAEPRLQRCALVGSGGALENLRALIADLRIDWRDVIVAGEYHERDGKLARLYDFAGPIPDTL